MKTFIPRPSTELNALVKSVLEICEEYEAEQDTALAGRPQQFKISERACQKLHHDPFRIGNEPASALDKIKVKYHNYDVAPDPQVQCDPTILKNKVPREILRLINHVLTDNENVPMQMSETLTATKRKPGVSTTKTGREGASTRVGRNSKRRAFRKSSSYPNLSGDRHDDAGDEEEIEPTPTGLLDKAFGRFMKKK